MLEICKSCDTVYELDKTELSSNISWLKCSVCNNTWIISDHKINNDSLINNEQISEKNDFTKVGNELAAIKFAVENKSREMSESNIVVDFEEDRKNQKNPVLDQKNKSVAQIAEDLAAASLKKSNVNIDKVNKFSAKKNSLSNNKNIEDQKAFMLLPTLIFLLFFIMGSFIFFRSSILGYGYTYFPKKMEIIIPTIVNYFNLVDLPILADLDNISLLDFGATFERKNVKFFGILKNKSHRPLIMPQVKAIVVTADGKILAETFIPIKEKILLPNENFKFSQIIETNFKGENISVRATLLKEVNIKNN